MCLRRLSRIAWFLLLVLAAPLRAQTPTDIARQTAAQYAQQGDALSLRGQIPQAIAAYTEAIRHDPNRPAYHYSRGMAFRSIKDYARAEEDFAALIRLAPQNPEAHYLHATCYPFGPMPSVWDQTSVNSDPPAAPEAGHERAIADLTEAIRLDPRMTKAYFARAAEYLMTERDYARALADFDAALRLTTAAPQLAYLYWCRGYAHALLKGDQEKAIADYTRALAADPKMPMAYAARACAFQRLGKMREALADYTTAINLDQRYGLAYRKRAEVFTALGDPQQAEADRIRARLLPIEPMAAPAKP